MMALAAFPFLSLISMIVIGAAFVTGNEDWLPGASTHGKLRTVPR